MVGLHTECWLQHEAMGSLDDDAYHDRVKQDPQGHVSQGFDLGFVMGTMSSGRMI